MVPLIKQLRRSVKKLTLLCGMVLSFLCFLTVLKHLNQLSLPYQYF
uniref:GLTB n=1 Tax=Arundo donax TaxID=35708 RepID=A0A0A9BP68_ARUDO